MSKVYIFWAKKVQSSYLSWHWRVMQNLRKTDLLPLGKWHEEFGKFSPNHSKMSKLQLWWDPFVQNRKRNSLKITEKLYVMTMKNDTKIEEELTCHFKTDMKNITNFDPNNRKSKKFVLIGSLWPKYLLFELQKYRGVIFHWRVMHILKKNWIVVWKKTWEIWQILTRALEIVKIATLVGTYCPK